MTMTIDAEVETSTRALCTFWLGGLLFGLDVLRTQEVLRAQRITEVPTAPPVVVGLMNLRGQIVPCCELRELLSLGRRSDDRDALHVVVRNGDEPVSLLVDEIGDVVDVVPDRFEAAPSTVSAAVRELLVGAHKLDDRLLLELNTDRMLAGLRAGGDNGGSA